MTGSISGSGLASAKIIAPGAIEAASASLITFGALTPINTSASFMAACISPVKLFGLLLSMNHCCMESSDFIALLTTPVRLYPIMFFAPLRVSNRAMAFPAAPTPLRTIFTSLKFLLTSFNELRSAAKTTIAVPC